MIEENKEREAFLAGLPKPPAVDDLVEGPVISIDKGAVYIDLPPFGTGIIYGREFINARDIIKKINVGDIVAGKVVGLGGKDGYIEISLKEARQALIWSEAEGAIREKRVFELAVVDANKGGLIINWQGISGFLPALDRALAEGWGPLPIGTRSELSQPGAARKDREVPQARKANGPSTGAPPQIWRARHGLAESRILESPAIGKPGARQCRLSAWGTSGDLAVAPWSETGV